MLNSLFIIHLHYFSIILSSPLEPNFAQKRTCRFLAYAASIIHIRRERFWRTFESSRRTNEVFRRPPETTPMTNDRFRRTPQVFPATAGKGPRSPDPLRRTPHPFAAYAAKFQTYAARLQTYAAKVAIHAQSHQINR